MTVLFHNGYTCAYKDRLYVLKQGPGQSFWPEFDVGLLEMSVHNLKLENKLLKSLKKIDKVPA